MIWIKRSRCRFAQYHSMAMHKRILEWQAAHPTITWICWLIVWIVVLVLLFRPSSTGGMT
ncbi:MAG: hypothetical protein OJF58_000038 [Enhydrobacter sp.]|nr:MAG: hypothetical protein OJF58_000038 [Enhydrobacter sp.]